MYKRQVLYYVFVVLKVTEKIKGEDPEKQINNTETPSLYISIWADKQDRLAKETAAKISARRTILK